MSKLPQDNFKQKVDRLTLETKIQEGGIRSDEIDDHAEDVPPARSDLANFMDRAGWGILIAVLVLAVFGYVVWRIFFAPVV
jgi:hypothetical protein